MSSSSPKSSFTVISLEEISKTSFNISKRLIQADKENCLNHENIKAFVLEKILNNMNEDGFEFIGVMNGCAVFKSNKQ